MMFWVCCPCHRFSAPRRPRLEPAAQQRSLVVNDLQGVVHWQLLQYQRRLMDRQGLLRDQCCRVQRDALALHHGVVSSQTTLLDHRLHLCQPQWRSRAGLRMVWRWPQPGAVPTISAAATALACFAPAHAALWGSCGGLAHPWASGAPGLQPCAGSTGLQSRNHLALARLIQTKTLALMVVPIAATTIKNAVRRKRARSPRAVRLPTQLLGPITRTRQDRLEWCSPARDPAV